MKQMIRREKFIGTIGFYMGRITKVVGVVGVIEFGYGLFNEEYAISAIGAGFLVGGLLMTGLSTGLREKIDVIGKALTSNSTYLSNKIPAIKNP